MRSSACDVAPAAPSVTVRLPGTCGEWVQGTLDGVSCLVSCAIDWYATTSVTLDAAPGAWQLPVDAPKAAHALRLALAVRGNPAAGGTLRLGNPLPRGRGYASSTADVAGTIYALGLALGAPFAPTEVAWLAAQVEPSDGIMFPGPTLFAHRDAAFHRSLGPLPRLAVVVLDPGGCVDTLTFNRADHARALKRAAAAHREAFGLLTAGLAAGDAQMVAQAATLSARTHQAILPSALVDAAMEMLTSVGALGICRAHSGTLVGLICDPAAAAEVAARVIEKLPGLIVRQHACPEMGHTALAKWPNHTKSKD